MRKPPTEKSKIDLFDFSWLSALFALEKLNYIAIASRWSSGAIVDHFIGAIGQPKHV